MSLSENKYLVYARNKWMYYTILFVGFVVAVKILPFISSKLEQYIQNALLLEGSSLLVAYIAAIYILPEIGFMIYKTVFQE